jgi:hypothetical protein
MFGHLCCYIGLITTQPSAEMISLPKLYDFRHSVGAILSVMAGFEKMRISGIPKRGTNCLQS